MASRLRRKSRQHRLRSSCLSEENADDSETRHCRDQIGIKGTEVSKQKFENVWDAIEDDPVKREIYKLRSELIHVITEYIKANNLKQREVASLLGISQPRVSTLVKGDFESFRLDTLVVFAVKCGHTVSIVAA